MAEGEGGSGVTERRFDGGDRSAIDLTTCCVMLFTEGFLAYLTIHVALCVAAWPSSEARRRSTRERALTFLAGASLYLHADNITNLAINPDQIS